MAIDTALLKLQAVDAMGLWAHSITRGRATTTTSDEGTETIEYTTLTLTFTGTIQPMSAAATVKFARDISGFDGRHIIFTLSSQTGLSGKTSAGRSKKALRPGPAQNVSR